jgi:hypothetical protein
VGIAGYVNLNDRQTLINASKELQVLLRSAQKKARVGDKPVGCDTLNAYSVTTVTGVGSQAVLKAECRTGSTNTSYTIDTLQFPPNVQMSEAHVIRFYVLQGGVTSAYTYQLQSNGGTYTFKVDDGGSIDEGKLENTQSESKH